MTATTATDTSAIPLRDVEHVLSQQMQEGQEARDKPVQRARMSNLVIFCNHPDLADRVSAEVPGIVAVHPARVFVLVAEEADKADADVTASVNAWCHLGGVGQKICSEQINLRAQGHAVQRLPFAVRGLLIGDLPTNLWWAAPLPPPLSGSLLYDLADRVQQIIYDSIGWTEPARGVAATAAWLPTFERGPGEGPWRVVSDLNWRRLKYWRRLMGQGLDPASAPGALESITEVLVEHGPHAVVQAWELVSWLVSRLHWQVQVGRVQPGVEITWQVMAPHGSLRLRIRRLPEGPSEVRRVRIACKLDGKPGALDFVTHDERRLAVMPEGVEATARTVTVQPQSLAELVGRQLSDRERDAAFRESMAVAQVLAQSVL